MFVISILWLSFWSRFCLDTWAWILWDNLLPCRREKIVKNWFSNWLFENEMFLLLQYVALLRKQYITWHELYMWDRYKMKICAVRYTVKKLQHNVASKLLFLFRLTDSHYFFLNSVIGLFSHFLICH